MNLDPPLLPLKLMSITWLLDAKTLKPDFKPWLMKMLDWTNKLWNLVPNSNNVKVDALNSKPPLMPLKLNVKPLKPEFNNYLNLLLISKVKLVISPLNYLQWPLDVVNLKLPFKLLKPKSITSKMLLPPLTIKFKDYKLP